MLIAISWAQPLHRSGFLYTRLTQLSFKAAILASNKLSNQHAARGQVTGFVPMTHDVIKATVTKHVQWKYQHSPADS